MTLPARRRRPRDVREPSRVKTRPVLATSASVVRRGVDEHKKNGPVVSRGVDDDKKNGPVVRRAVDDYKKNAYREAILDAAEAVFVRVGYHEAKMADIAAQTGFSVGTLYNYFDNKEAVFAALVARGCGDFLKDVFDEDDDGDPIVRLHALVERGFAHVERRGAMFALFTQLGGFAEFDIRRFGGESAEQNCLRMIGRLEQLFGQAQQLSRVRADREPSVLAVALAGMLNGAIFAWVRGGRTERLVPRASELIALFLEGAGKK